MLPAAALWYAKAVKRCRADGVDVGVSHWLPFAAGMLIAAASAFSPLAALAEGSLLTAATFQHVLLSDVAPVLVVLGLRPPLTSYLIGSKSALQRHPSAWSSQSAWRSWSSQSARLTGALSKVARHAIVPAVVIPLWIAFTWLWAIPSVADYSAQHAPIAWLSHLTLLASGLGLWWLVVDPLPSSKLRANGQRMAMIAATHVASACVCLPMMWLTHSQYPLFASHAHVYGLSAATDQHIAGGLMTLTELAIFSIACAAVFISILNRSEANDAVAAEWLTSD